MSSRNFREMLENQWAQGKHLCVGLDSELEKIDERQGGQLDDWTIISGFNEKIIKATVHVAAAYKPNLAFYLRHGLNGLKALEVTIKWCNFLAPEAPVILDAKFGDIDNTNNGYVAFAFDKLYADAVTVNPYMGGEALKPFLERKDKGIFVLCRTSNPGGGEFQDLNIAPVMEGSYGHPFNLYAEVALRVTAEWNGKGNCGLVVGPTAPQELEQIRRITSDLPILIEEEGSNLEESVKKIKHRFLINVSRGIIFAGKGGNFAQAARTEAERLHNTITQTLKGG